MKEHKKLYKHGKLWVTATLFALAFGITVGAGQAEAATDSAAAAPVIQQVSQPVAKIGGGYQPATFCRN